MTDDGSDTRDASDRESSRRRLVVTLLARREDAPTLEELAREVAAAEAGTAPEAVADAAVAEAAASLARTHVPALTASGLVEYDRERGVVRPTRRVAEPQEGDGDRRRWALAYALPGVLVSVAAAWAVLAAEPTSNGALARLALVGAAALVAVGLGRYLGVSAPSQSP